MASVFPGYLTKWTTSRVRKLGVDVKDKSAFKSVSADKETGKTTLHLGNGESLTLDHVGDSVPNILDAISYPLYNELRS
jgi:programmed cell death 8 (apoptosis-inducing factor)